MESSNISSLNKIVLITFRNLVYVYIFFSFCIEVGVLYFSLFGSQWTIVCMFLLAEHFENNDLESKERVLSNKCYVTTAIHDLLHCSISEGRTVGWEITWLFLKEIVYTWKKIFKDLHFISTICSPIFRCSPHLLWCVSRWWSWNLNPFLFLKTIHACTF